MAGESSSKFVIQNGLLRAGLGLFLLVVLSAALVWIAAPVWASEAAQAPAAAGSQSMMTPFQFIFGSVQFFLIGFFIYFWLAIRPQHLKDDERKKFVNDLKKNDEVITSGGLFGRVVALKEDSATLEIASGVKVKVHVDHVMPVPPVPEGARLQAAIQKSAEQ